MNPHPEPGQNRQPTVVCLLPGGSADETVNGLTHLFEHLLIKTLFEGPQNAVIAGYTTEDYILLSSNDLEPADYIETIHRMTFPEDDVERNKNGLLKEIHREASKKREEFFRKIWDGTPYEKSPLGTPRDVQSITPAEIESFRNRLLEKVHFFFTRNNGMERYEPEKGITIESEDNPASLEVTGIKKKTMTFQGQGYNIYYVKNDNHRIEGSSEVLYLLVRLLQLQNPGKRIQISEKKAGAALILENGSLLPAVDTIHALWEPARRQIARDVESIASNFRERALNQLESNYFYGRTWESRIRRLYKLTPLQVTELLRQMK
jgi:hypothetical protein